MDALGKTTWLYVGERFALQLGENVFRELFELLRRVPDPVIHRVAAHQLDAVHLGAHRALQAGLDVGEKDQRAAYDPPTSASSAASPASSRTVTPRPAGS